MRRPRVDCEAARHIQPPGGHSSRRLSVEHSECTTLQAIVRRDPGTQANGPRVHRRHPLIVAFARETAPGRASRAAARDSSFWRSRLKNLLHTGRNRVHDSHLAGKILLLSGPSPGGHSGGRLAPRLSVAETGFLAGSRIGGVEMVRWTTHRQDLVAFLCMFSSPSERLRAPFETTSGAEAQPLQRMRGRSGASCRGARRGHRHGGRIRRLRPDSTRTASTSGRTNGR